MYKTLSTTRLRQVQKTQRGASLIIVLIVLTIVSLLGVAGIQVSMMSERGARNDRDMQLAWQSAEEALIDAEFDLFGTTGITSTRVATFNPLANQPNVIAFTPGCGVGSSAGLCELVDSGKQAWLTVPFTTTGSSAQTAAYGQFTGRTFAAGTLGIQPAAPPRYVIELIPDPGHRDLNASVPKYVYRVTAMGFGPRADIQAVVQMIYRN